MDYVYLAIIGFLLAFLFVKEKQTLKLIHEILSFKISKDSIEFQNLTTREEKEEIEGEKEELEIPLEDVPAEELLKNLK